MKMVEESDRVWMNIDLHAKSLGDHCVRITKLEQEHQYSTKTKKDIIIYILAGVAIASLITRWLL